MEEGLFKIIIRNPEYFYAFCYIVYEKLLNKLMSEEENEIVNIESCSEESPV